MPVISNGPGSVQTAYVSRLDVNLESGVTQFYWPNAAQLQTNIMPQYLNILESAVDSAIQLPDARQVSVGYNIIINNETTIPETGVEILDNSGSLIVEIPSPGAEDPPIATAYYFSLKDNSTAAGVWTYIGFGASVISAQAADFAGFGLVASAGTLDTVTYVNHIILSGASTYTIGAPHQSQMVIWQSGAGVITLDGTVEDGFYCLFSNLGSGQVTFNASGGGVINYTGSGPGVNNMVINPGQSFFLIKSNKQLSVPNWWTCSLYTVGGSSTFTTVTVNAGSGGNIILNGTQAAASLLKFTGTLPNNTKILFPAVTNQWEVFNNTSGAFTLTVQLVGPTGSAYVIPPNGRQIFYSDGTSLFDIPTVVNTNPPTFAQGTAGNPGITFTGDTQSGFYQVTGGQVSLSANTTPVWRGTSTEFDVFLPAQMTDIEANNISTGTLTFTGPQFVAPTGSSTNIPGIAFNGDTSTGFYRSAAHTITLVGNGNIVAVFTYGASAETIIQTLLQVNGDLHVTGNVVLTTPLPIAQGGTGGTTQTTAKNALLGTPTTGSLLYYNGTTWVALAPGANGQTLKMAGGIPTWTA